MEIFTIKLYEVLNLLLNNLGLGEMDGSIDKIRLAMN